MNMEEKKADFMRRFKASHERKAEYIANMEMTDKEKLITENMGYVVTLARQYSCELLDTDDLVSEGTIGIIKAAEKFDPGRGKPFVTFAAPYIRAAIEAAIRRVTGEVTVKSTDESIPAGSRNNYTLLHVLEDRNAQRADAQMEDDLLKEELEQRIHLLDERETAVIRRYFGLGSDRMTMAEIAGELDLKRERVRQIRNKALRKLHKASA